MEVFPISKYQIGRKKLDKVNSPQTKHFCKLETYTSKKE